MAKIRDKQPDADAGRKIVDEQLEGLEARLTSIYRQTAKEVQADLDKFLSKYEKEDAKKQAMVESGDLSKDDYLEWRERQIFRTNAMKAKIDDVTERIVHADEQAMAMVNDQLPETYATSYNFGGYKAETQANKAGFDYTQFTIINQDAVRTLAKEDPDLIPWKPEPDVAEDKRWNRQHVQNAVFQGITKGESMDDVAKRLLPVVNMDKNAAIRTARTAVNGVENKGRKDATERVKEAGIPMVEVWSATHDERTRDTHILLDGTEPDENGMFGKGILSRLIAYPGDPSGDPEEVYNCRCGLISQIKGIDHSKDDDLYAKMMEEEYFDDWVKVKEERQEKEEAFQKNKEGAAERVAERQAAKQSSQEEKSKEKQPEELPKASELLPAEDLSSGKRSVVQGEDITGTWERRSDKFDFEIDDVIDAQGFNGLPKVVSEEEFEKAVKESNFIAQRTYSAPSQEILDSYRDQLYNGDWYVDCSEGGTQYGQGMYAASTNGTEVTDSIREEMAYYQEKGEERINEGDIKAVHNVETFTLTPDAKTIDYYEAKDQLSDYKWKKYAMESPDAREGDDERILEFNARLLEESKKTSRSEAREMLKNEDERLFAVYEYAYDKSLDDEMNVGTYAAMRGYDAVIHRDKYASEGECDYAVILNRTKVIFKEDKEKK